MPSVALPQAISLALLLLTWLRMAVRRAAVSTGPPAAGDPSGGEADFPSERIKSPSPGPEGKTVFRMLRKAEKKTRTRIRASMVSRLLRPADIQKVPCMRMNQPCAE